LVAAVLTIALLVGAHPVIAGRAGRQAASWARHVRSRAFSLTFLITQRDAV
jgi:hypothetical protein